MMLGIVDLMTFGLSSLEKYILISWAYFRIGLFVFLLLSYKSSFYVQDARLLIREVIYKYCLFLWVVEKEHMIVFFGAQKFYILMPSIYFSLVACTFKSHI